MTVLREAIRKFLVAWLGIIALSAISFVLGWGFADALGLLSLLAGAGLVLLGWMVDLSTSIGASKFRRYVLRQEETWNSKVRRREESRALGYLLSGLMMLVQWLILSTVFLTQNY